MKEAVTVECDRASFGPFFDRFGEQELSIRKAGDRFRLRFHVAVTDIFLGWIAGLGEGVRIVEPQAVCDKMTEISEGLLKRHAGGPVKAVIFDLGMVLVDFRYRAYMEEIGFDEDAIAFFADNIVLSPLWCRLDRGELSMKEITEILKERYPQYRNEIEVFFTNIRGIVIPFPESYGYIKRLKDMGYRVYILSNYPDELYEMQYESWVFLPLADGAVISAKEKLAKPAIATKIIIAVKIIDILLSLSSSFINALLLKPMFLLL